MALQLHDDPRALAQEWDDLADRVGATPFTRPGWVLPWQEAFGSGSLQLATLTQDGRMVAAMPVVRHGARFTGPVNYHSPSFGPVAESRAAAVELLGGVFREDVASIELRMLDEDAVDVARTAARDAGRLVLERPLITPPHVDLTGSWEDYLKTFSRNRRKEWRRVTRRLEEQGQVRVDIAGGDGALHARLEELYAVEGSGWKAERGTAIASAPNVRGFYTRVAEWADARGALRLCFLRVDGVPVAVDLALVEDGVWYALKGGYDVAWARYGPGIALLQRTLEEAFAQGLRRFELLGGADAYKLVWASGTSRRTAFAAYAASPRGRAAWMGARARDHARPIVQRVLERRTAARGEPAGKADGGSAENVER